MDTQVAVKAVLRNQAGEFLLLKQKGRWHGVGGRLWKGETLEEGLRREIREETGITDVRIGQVVHADEWFAAPEREQVHIVALFYVCETPVAAVTLSDEHDTFAWVDSSELERLGDMVEPEIRRAVMVSSALRKT